MVTDTIELVSYTAESIRTDALTYNAAYPEAAADIAASTPIVQVMYRSDGYGRVKVWVTPGLQMGDGGFIAASDARVFGPMRVFDGREIAKNARWIARKTVSTDVEVVITR